MKRRDESQYFVFSVYSLVFFLFSEYIRFDSSSPRMLLLMIEFLLGNITTPSVLIPGYPNKKKSEKRKQQP